MSRIEDAERLLASGALAEAAAAFQAALHEQGGGVRAFAGLADIARRRGDGLGTLAALAKAVRIAPAAPGTRLELAEELRRARAFAEAEPHYRAVLAVKPVNSTALVGLARCAEERGARAEALRLAEKALEVVPGKESVRRFVKLLKSDASRTAHREVPPEASAAPKKKKIDTPLAVAKQLAGAGELEEALALARSSLNGSPADVEPLQLIAGLEEKRGRLNEAIAALERLLALAPDNWRAQLRIALVHKKAEALDRYVAALRRAHAMAPDEPEVVVSCADLLSFVDQSDAEQALLQGAISHRPDSQALSNRLVAILMRQGQHEEALAVLDQADRRWPGDVRTARLRARIHESRGDFRRAAGEIAALLAARPEDKALRLEHALASIKGGDFAAAERTLAEFGSIEPAHQARVALLRGRMALHRGEIEAAVKELETACRLDPRNAEAHDRLSVCAIRRLDQKALALHAARTIELQQFRLNLRGAKTSVARYFHGKILNEFGIDPELVGEASQARTLAASGDPSPLARLVLDNPGFLAPALAYCDWAWPPAARGSSPSTAGDASPIPRTIVQFWDQKPPPAVVKLMEGWNRQAGFAHVVFDLKQAREFVDAHFTPRHVRALRIARVPAQKADLFRLCYLHAKGGLYVDADDARLADVSTVIPPEKDLVLYREVYGTLGNNVIAVRPGHPAIAIALERALESVLANEGDAVWAATGPGLLTRAVATFHAQCANGDAKGAERLHVWEAHELAGTIAMHLRLPHKRGAQHWSQAGTESRGVDVGWLLKTISPPEQKAAE